MVDMFVGVLRLHKSCTVENYITDGFADSILITMEDEDDFRGFFHSGGTGMELYSCYDNMNTISAFYSLHSCTHKYLVVYR